MPLMFSSKENISDYDKIADIIMSHSEIDNLMSDLLADFFQGGADLSYTINKKLNFEQKRTFLLEIIKKYKNSTWKKELTLFLETIQKLEKIRNKIAHGNTLREKLRKDAIRKAPYLEKNPTFNKEWPRDIDIDALFDEYDNILKTKNPYIKNELKIVGRTDNLYFLIERLEQIPPIEIIKELENE